MSLDISCFIKARQFCGVILTSITILCRFVITSHYMSHNLPIILRVLVVISFIIRPVISISFVHKQPVFDFAYLNVVEDLGRSFTFTAWKG